MVCDEFGICLRAGIVEVRGLGFGGGSRAGGMLFRVSRYFVIWLTV